MILYFESKKEKIITYNFLLFLLQRYKKENSES